MADAGRDENSNKEDYEHDTQDIVHNRRLIVGCPS
jgi:hypothetical protein